MVQGPRYSEKCPWLGRRAAGSSRARLLGGPAHQGMEVIQSQRDVGGERMGSGKVAPVNTGGPVGRGGRQEPYGGRVPFF